MTQHKFRSQDELHHIFVAYDTASSGGTQKVTLKSGKNCQIEVPPASTEDSKLPLKGCGLQGNDVFMVIHTWFDKSQDFEKSIDLLITHADIKPESRIRVRKVYELVKYARSTQDLAALELLDFIVFSSNTESLVCQRYKVGSQNYLLIKIEQCIEDSLAASKLDETDKQSIRGTYQCIRAGEYINNFGVLNQLDSIIQNSSCPEELKQLYLRASITSRAITVDLFIINLIEDSPSLSSNIYRKEILTAYTQG